MKRRKIALLAAGVVWLAAICGGSAVLMKHAQTPGALGSSPASWPAEAGDRGSGKASMLVFLHPDCPCSRATLSGLARVVAASRREIDVRAVFHRPGDWSPTEEESALWEKAARIPRVKPLHDRDGRLAKLFGAETSGTTVLYDERGRLLFAGGITGSRGHEGDNANEDALRACLSEAGQGKTRFTDVFGCSIF